MPQSRSATLVKTTPDPEAIPAIPLLALPPGTSDHEGVYQRLRAAIMTGVFAPDTTLTLRGLAEALSCSQTPVREAVRRLSSEHAIAVLENRRMCIPPMTARRFEEILSLRLTVEVHAARRALPYVSDAVIAAMADLDRQLDAALAAGDQTAVTALNQAFHRRLYAANPHQTVLPVVESIWLQLGPFQRQVVERGLKYYVQDRHRQILDALRRRDGPVLGDAILNDITDGIAISGRRYLAEVQR
ncbi:transcriptional regulator, GntR family [Loktanella fryxellensis]|uniref:Transcriptional regulator, GntR family n=1 Tax=Loktanella fryxellensis TaxID=245187 RepID=A0A1H8IZQ3_9RHOB|nr:GntR family transcriptional regulator [Loktanella fryxellensis]SEN74074.1 transcriptional regulator, GntR family [Loktanella fryxellensis]